MSAPRHHPKPAFRKCQECGLGFPAKANEAAASDYCTPDCYQKAKRRQKRQADRPTKQAPLF